MEIEIEEQSHYLNVRKNTFVFLICFFLIHLLYLKVIFYICFEFKNVFSEIFIENYFFPFKAFINGLIINSKILIYNSSFYFILLS